MSEPQTLDIVSKVRESTVTIYFPLLLRKDYQKQVHEYLKNKYADELLYISFGGREQNDGDRLHLMVRKNFDAFQKMKQYAATVKELAEGTQKPNRGDDEADDDD